MANSILDRYGIKEVADVTFYSIKDDGTIDVPVLYLDTLKVSTIEQTAESADARGGKGNAALVSWDYGKEITVTLEDALYSPKSLALMFGDVGANGIPNSLTDNIADIRKTVWAETVTALDSAKKTLTAVVNEKTFNLTGCTFYAKDGTPVDAPTLEDSTKSTKLNFGYATGTFTVTSAFQIDVSANGFPGTYYITGDTYARNESNGKDEFFQFIIPKAKVLSESNTITLEAEGDPTVFSMSLKVLRPKDGVMMKLVQYELPTTTTTTPTT